MSPWVKYLPLKLIYSMAAEHEVDGHLIAAMVSVESAGQECATRYEPHFRWLLTPERFANLINITEETEATAQKTSFGLMQVMGAVARELGHEGHLTELCKPEVGLYYGIKKIKQLQGQYSKFEDSISAYNQGAPRADITGVYYNQKYVNKVMDRYNYLRR